jgi:5-methylcytosine-specific restriction endonuclease McrA
VGQSAEFKRNAKIILAGRPLCVKCGERMIFKGDSPRPRWWLLPEAATVNHKVPKVERGSDRLVNLEPMHRGCNSQLGNQQRRNPADRRIRDFGVPRLGIYD